MPSLTDTKQTILNRIRKGVNLSPVGSAQHFELVSILSSVGQAFAAYEETANAVSVESKWRGANSARIKNATEAAFSRSLAKDVRSLVFFEELEGMVEAALIADDQLRDSQDISNTAIIKNDPQC